MAEHEILKHSRRAYTIWKKTADWKRKAGELFIEVLVIVFAITVSMMFERWRGMKTFVSILIFIVASLNSSAQQTAFPQWGKLNKGNYAVGYKDTVIFKPDETFSYYTYKGNKPFFVSIWYPAIDNNSVPFMRFNNYMSFPKQDSYGILYDSLIKIFNNILIADGVSIHINGGPKQIPFDEIQRSLYQDILQTKVMAKRNLQAVRRKFPCIFYHHGAQSTPYDNNVFCEFMASHGFVVISSNYNLPDESAHSRLTSATDKKFNRITDLLFVLEQTRLMDNVNTTQIIAAGHSAGAQAEIAFDTIKLKKPFKKVISFHTTLEDKTLIIAKKYWPSFSNLFENKSEFSTTPVILFAPLTLDWKSYKDSITGREIITSFDTSYPKYIPFRNNTTTPFSFVTVKHTVTHDGFISLGNLRFPYAEKYQLVDKVNIHKQQYYYEQIILLAHKISIASITNSTISKNIFTDKNFLIEYNDVSPMPNQK